MSTVYDMISIQQPSGRANIPTSLRSLRQSQNKPSQLPRQSLDDGEDSEDDNDFDTIISRGLRTPTIAMGKWLCSLPSIEELGPNEHFAVGEYDDENGQRKSALFVYESVGEQQHDEFMHPRTPPLPSTVPTAAFTAFDFLDNPPPQAEPQHHSSFKITAINSVGNGKIILKRFAKTAGRVLEQLAVMPDYSNSHSHTSGPSISLPFQNEGKQEAFNTISIQEAQARDKARRANYIQQQAQKTAPKPLKVRQVGNASRSTLWEDFLTYQTPDVSEEQLPQPHPRSPPRIPDHINRPSRKPLPAKTPTQNLDKSLPSSPDTDSLRRRTQMPLGVLVGKRPDILAVPTNRAVLNNHRNPIASQYGLVLESSEHKTEEEDDTETVWPAEFQSEGRKRPLWWQFEDSSAEELDPTQEVWARMEESVRSGGGIRVALGRSRSRSKREEEEDDDDEDGVFF